MVLYRGRMIASRISFVERGQIFNWQSFSDKQYSNLRPNYLLMDYIIKQALASGIRIVNLGWSPPDAGPLIDFKKRWGGVKTPYRGYTYFSRLGRLIYGLKR